jgi:LPPG:FO 2-phospho-L-lactate transferase
MTDDEVRTRIGTADGPLDFQHYFVRDRAEPAVRSLAYSGADSARPSEAALDALRNPEVAAIIIAPSNPYLSIDPILALPAIRQSLRDTAAPVVAVSPIVGGRAVKGPTAKIMAELGLEVSPISVARHYGDLLNGFILDESDRDMAAQVENLGLEVTICDTIMKSVEDKKRLARVALDFAGTLAPPGK